MIDLALLIPLVASATGATVDGAAIGCDATPDAEVVGITIYPNATAAADASNYRTITISSDAGTLATWSTQSTGDGALTVDTPVELDLSTTVSHIIPRGTKFKIATAHSGTGVALDLNVVVTYRPVGS